MVGVFEWIFVILIAVLSCFLVNFVLKKLVKDEKKRKFLSAFADVLVSLFAVMYILTSLDLGVIIDGGKSRQKAWIYDTLPQKIWQEQTTDLANTEYHRIADVLQGYANAAIRQYDDAGTEKDLDEYLSMSLFDLEDLYLLNGGSSSNERKREAEIERYKKHYETITDNLRENMQTLLRLRDSTLSFRSEYEDNQLCQTLLGTPGAIASPSIDLQMSIARSIMTKLYFNRKRPEVSSCSYDRKEKVWKVRMDSAPNQQVQFFKRDDGAFDIEWTGNKGYIPEYTSTSSSIAATSVAPEIDDEEDVHPSRVEPESYVSAYTGFLEAGEKRYGIEMKLQIDEFGNVEGYYRYLSQPADSRILLSGNVMHLAMLDSFELDSQDGTEHFSLSQNTVAATEDDELDELSGTWRKYKTSTDRENDVSSFTKELDVVLRQDV